MFPIQIYFSVIQICVKEELIKTAPSEYVLFNNIP